MHGTGQYTISDLAKLISISRPTVYRTLLRNVVQAQVERQGSAMRPLKPSATFNYL